jgi:hypothetical protein
MVQSPCKWITRTPDSVEDTDNPVFGERGIFERVEAIIFFGKVSLPTFFRRERFGKIKNKQAPG